MSHVLFYIVPRKESSQEMRVADFVAMLSEDMAIECDSSKLWNKAREIVSLHGSCVIAFLDFYNDGSGKPPALGTTCPDVRIGSDALYSHGMYPHSPYKVRGEKDEYRDLVGVTFELFAEHGYSLSFECFDTAFLPDEMIGDTYDEGIALAEKSRLGKNQKARLSEIREQTGIQVVSLAFHARCLSEPGHGSGERFRKTMKKYRKLIDDLEEPAAGKS